MTYRLIQDSRGSTALGASATAVLAAQGRIAAAVVELRLATESYERLADHYNDEANRVRGNA